MPTLRQEHTHYFKPQITQIFRLNKGQIFHINKGAVRFFLFFPFSETYTPLISP